MSFYVAEGWSRAYYRYTDPDCFMTCDNPACDRPWVAGSGLICWALSDDRVRGGVFTDKLLIGCNAECLAAAQAAKRDRAFWDGRPVRIGQPRRRSLHGWTRCVIRARAILQARLLGSSCHSPGDQFNYPLPFS